MLVLSDTHLETMEGSHHRLNPVLLFIDDNVVDTHQLAAIEGSQHGLAVHLGEGPSEGPGGVVLASGGGGVGSHLAVYLLIFLHVVTGDLGPIHGVD